MPATIQANSHVTLRYILKNDAGEVLDEAHDEGEEVTYVHGYGMLVPGLEANLAGLKAGEKRDIVVSAEDGFGERDEELMMEIERSELPDPAKVEVGDELVASSADGDEVVLRVVEVQKDGVLVDANHPLAGVTLHYAVEVCAVRDATEDEIREVAEAVAQMEEEGEHVHGPDCQHDEEGSPLVSLGKKKPVLN